jgi:hypothetical protein
VPARRREACGKREGAASDGEHAQRAGGAVERPRGCERRRKKKDRGDTSGSGAERVVRCEQVGGPSDASNALCIAFP